MRTVDNFGFSGERPSHPELLDYLALKFMDGGWSVKALIKEIVMSKTYRQGSISDFGFRISEFRKPNAKSVAHTEASPQSAIANPRLIDPDNRLLWRANKRRLDAEVIRDSMLAVSGALDTSRRPGSLVAELDGQSVSLIGFSTKLPPDLDGSHRRSIYLPVLRDQLPDVLEQFDVANPNLVTGDRDVTNVPLQALYLMNGPFVQEQAAALAQRLAKENPTLKERIRRAFALCFNALPMLERAATCRAFLPNHPRRRLGTFQPSFASRCWRARSSVSLIEIGDASLERFPLVLRGWARPLWHREGTGPVCLHRSFPALVCSAM